MTNWKTTASGIASILAGAAALVKCFTSPMPGVDPVTCYGTAVGLIVVGIGLLNAKDNNVTNAPNPVEPKKVDK